MVEALAEVALVIGQTDSRQVELGRAEVCVWSSGVAHCSQLRQ